MSLLHTVCDGTDHFRHWCTTFSWDLSGESSTAGPGAHPPSFFFPSFPLPFSFLLPPSHSPTSLFLSHSFLSMLHPSPPILTTLQHRFSLLHSKSFILTLKPSVSLTPHGPITHLSSGRPGHYLHTSITGG